MAWDRKRLGRALGATLALLPLMGCLVAKNVPNSAVFHDARAPGEAVVVGSVSVPRDPDSGVAAHFVFQAYDPVTDRLIVDGDSFLFVRATCFLSNDAECDLRRPLHQVVTVPAGHYILTHTVLSSMGDIYFFYVPGETSWGSGAPMPGASVAAATSPRIVVEAGETLYIGHLAVGQLESERKLPRDAVRTLVWSVEEQDTAARAALAEAGFPAEAMVYRPPVR